MTRLLITVIYFSFLPSLVLAARAPDSIVREFIFNAECSAQILRYLKIQKEELVTGLSYPIPAAGRSHPADSKNMHNTIRLEDNSLIFSGRWNDLAGAIPRRAGPRYISTSPEFVKLHELSSFWKQVFAALQLTPEALAELPDDWPIKSLEICNDSQMFQISSYRRKGYSNQYGSAPDHYFLVIAVGEHLPAYVPDEKYE